MVVAKNDEAHRSLVEQFSGRTVEKEYRAVIVGKTPKERDVISAPIGRHKKYRHKMTVTGDGREAVTEYTVERVWNTALGSFSELRVGLRTGRTHQIRVHLSAMGHPIVGDPIYSKKWEKYRVPYLLLASVRLEFDHPQEGGRMRFSIDIPEHMKDFIKRIDGVA